MVRGVGQIGGFVDSLRGDDLTEPWVKADCSSVWAGSRLVSL